jgi:hypothetical protein
LSAVRHLERGKLRERVVNCDTLSPSCKPHSTNTGLGPLTVLELGPVGPETSC